MSSTELNLSVEQTLFDAAVEFGAKPGSVTRTATFDELGLDSLDLAEMRQIVKDKFGVELNRDMLGDVKNLGDIVDLVAGLVP